MTKENKLDHFINIAITNFYTIGKCDKAIYLYNLNISDKRHLALLHIANIVYNVFGYKIYLNTNLKNFIFARKLLKNKKILHFSFKKITDIEDFLNFIESANNEKDIYNTIYTEYYMDRKD